jgi:hypothetical protein
MELPQGRPDTYISRTRQLVVAGAALKATSAWGEGPNQHELKVDCWGVRQTPGCTPVVTTLARQRKSKSMSIGKLALPRRRVVAAVEQAPHAHSHAFARAQARPV